MEDRTPRPYASSDEDFEMVPDANGTSNAKDTLTLTAAAELSHVWVDEFSEAERAMLVRWTEEAAAGVEALVGSFPMDVEVHYHRRDGAREPVPWANTRRGRVQGVGRCLGFGGGSAARVWEMRTMCTKQKRHTRDYPVETRAVCVKQLSEQYNTVDVLHPNL